MQCIICRKKEFVPHFGGLFQCVRCRLVVAKEAFYKLDVKRLYHQGYFFGEEYHNYLEEKDLLEKGFERRLNCLRRFISNGCLLEIGSAYGFFLRIASKYFQCEGVELSSHAARYAREKFGLKIQEQDFLQARFARRRFDVVCMWDTIEHLQRPDLCLLKTSKLLKRGGIVCLTTGNIESLVPRIQRGSWRLIHPPTHLYYFSAKTIRLLLEKYGFEVIDESYPSYARSLIHIFHGLGMKSPFLHRCYLLARQLSLFKRIIISYNPHDIMFIIAKKAS